MFDSDDLFGRPEIPTRPATKRPDSRREKFLKRREKVQRQEARAAAETPRPAEPPASITASADFKAAQVANPQSGTVPPVRTGGQPQPAPEIARCQASPVEENYPDDHPIDDPSLLDTAEMLTSQSELDLEAFDLYRTGMSYRQLADYFDIHLNTAFDRVRRGRDVEAAQRRRSPDELLIAELSKLQRMERAVIFDAYAGELDAIRMVVRLITLRERMRKTVHGAVQATPAKAASTAPPPHREEQGTGSCLSESELAEFREILKKRLPEHADEFERFEQQTAQRTQTAQENSESKIGGGIDDNDRSPSDGETTGANAARTEREHGEASQEANPRDVSVNGARSPVVATDCRIARVPEIAKHDASTQGGGPNRVVSIAGTQGAVVPVVANIP